MNYRIDNLVGTNEDKHRRGHRVRELRKARVQIGSTSIPEGRSATISENVYRQFEHRIQDYLAIGMIRVTRLGAAPAAPAAPTYVMGVDLSAEPDQPVEQVLAVPTPEQADAFANDTLSTPAEEAPAEEPASPAKRRGRPPKEK